MDRFVIQGGRPLAGTVRVGGVKNVILPMMCAAVMADEGETVITDVPDLKDIAVLRKLIVELGGDARYDPTKKEIRIDASGVSRTVAPYELVKQMRASFLLAGALLGRFREFHISLPGGCAIGARPVNFHLRGFARLGAKVEEDGGLLGARAQRLIGSAISLDYPSHTATENLMMAAVLAQGETVIENAACEPEVHDFGNYLGKMGADIAGHGTPTITVRGVKKLRAVTYTPIPDRIVTGTFLCAAAITGGEVTVENTDESMLRIVLEKLSDMGCELDISSPGSIRIHGPERLRAVDIVTAPYPGFSTDLQPQFMALCAVANGVSLIRETVFENRFIHAPELNRMGASIRVTGDEAVAVGVKTLTGAPVMASDLRAGTALVLAGLAARGTTVVDRVYHIDRGYEQFEEKLGALGADITRENDND